MKHIGLFGSFTTVLALAICVPGPVHADTVDDAYADFMAGNYAPAFNRLFDFRVSHDGTLRVDFMLAVSGCRLADPAFKALGGYLLQVIPSWYAPLSQDHAADIQTQAQACPANGMSEEDVVARVAGKSDTPATALAQGRSNAGKDEALPAAPLPARDMSPLVPGLVYLQADYSDVYVNSAAQCSARCASEARCVAMTYIISQKRCWLKDRVPATSTSPDMISAHKVVK